MRPRRINTRATAAATLALVLLLSACSAGDSVEAEPSGSINASNSPDDPASDADPISASTSTSTASNDETVPTTPPAFVPLFFDPPEGYGGPVIYNDQGPVDEESVIPLIREPGADIVLFSAAVEGQPLTTAPDLMVMTLPSLALVTMDDGSYEAVELAAGQTAYRTDYYAGYGFASELAWLDGGTAVVAVSRTADFEQLTEWVGLVRRVDGAVSLDGAPSGLRELSRGRYFHQFGPIADSRGVVGTHQSTWTTGGQGVAGRVSGTIRIFARVLEPIDLLIVEELGQAVERVEVRGTTGLLARFPQQAAPSLAWVEGDTMLMLITATDSSADLVAMADSGEPASEAELEAQFASHNWGDPASTQVAEGIDIGHQWRLWSSPDAEFGVRLCIQTRLNGEEWPESFGCQIGDGLAGFGGMYGGTRVGDENFGFFAGLIPACAAEVAAAPDTGASRLVTAPAFEADDGRRYFTLVVPLPAFDQNTPLTTPFVKALDGDGVTFDDTSSGTWTVHC